MGRKIELTENQRISLRGSLRLVYGGDVGFVEGKKGGKGTALFGDEKENPQSFVLGGEIWKNAQFGRN